MSRRQVPPMVAGKARAAGEAGLRWLESLDGIVSELEERWHVTVGETLTGGSHAFVGLAEGEDGRKYVMKVEVPDTTEDEFMNGIRALKIADGNGYGKLYAYDIERRASLLERLGGVLRTMDYSPDEQMEIICGALLRTWKMPADGADLPDGAASVGWFRGFIEETWAALHQPCPRKVIDRAMEYLDSREAKLNPAEYVLLHGDAHNNNTLRTLDGQGFKLIDPDGIFYEREYDLGVLMREWPEEYREDPVGEGRRRCAMLSRLTGADEQGVWEWGFLQTVSTSLVLLQIGQEPLARQMLHVAECWCEKN